MKKADIVESKVFLRSFIKRVEIDGEKAKVHYILPMPPGGKTKEFLGITPITHPKWR